MGVTTDAVHGTTLTVDILDNAEALREREARYRAVIENVGEGIGFVDPEEQFTFANPAAEGIFGVLPTGLLGHSLRKFTTPEQFGVIREQTRQRRLNEKGLYEIEISRPDGEKRSLLITTVPQFDSQGEFVGTFGVFRDITQRKRAEETLRRYAEQLRVLTARLANAEEGERRRLAQELHDRVGQNLTALSINLNIVRDLLSPELAVRIGPRLEDSLELVSETMEHIRDVMAELRPPVLDDYGLLASLRWYGQRFAQRTGLAIATQGADPTPRLPLATEITLFRIAQEALTNAARHAQAHQVSVTLDAAAGGVRLTIADDGIGFDPELHTQPNGRHAWGLLTMSERAESAGGRLVMDAAPGRGTRVIVEVGSRL